MRGEVTLGGVCVCVCVAGIFFSGGGGGRNQDFLI